MKHLNTRELVLCSLFIALITAGTFIRIPVGTDVYTLQFLIHNHHFKWWFDLAL